MAVLKSHNTTHGAVVECIHCAMGARVPQGTVIAYACIDPLWNMNHESLEECLIKPGRDNKLEVSKTEIQRSGANPGEVLWAKGESFIHSTIQSSIHVERHLCAGAVPGADKT
jgi:hypothetical protein